ncbi:MAG: 4-hydroxythreonine-4-phosphate dehydrogenase PdxA [Limimaricola soesokkakensis]|uniref:4-hydroxythreonine-4-phosphate dehydrogenase PdxA n=1 Tax=Limimaricola soesokkakensis TaxID=1343159 RepID=UPI0040597CAB
MTPRIGIIPGDPSGIGPELIAKLMAAEGVREAAEILLIGDRCVLEQGMRQAGAEYALVPVDLEDWRAPPEGIAWLETEVAVETEASGRSVLATMDRALELLQAGHIDGLVFAPFNKAAMHMAGLAHADELHHMGERLGVTEYLSELNVLDGIWTSRTTSHIALRDVADAITPERLEEAVVLIDRTLRRSGIARPRISVAALNPHAGDGGNFGREEIDVPRPAIEAMQKRQMPVDGPWPSDTVFLKLRDVEIDAVVTMYHDQGQIALKLLGFERGVTVQGGLPYPVTTPAHGTAFDIAGQGRARVDAMRQAFDIARDMVANWQ